ncbi:MAG: D-alanine--D-alanine ligase [Cyanobacteria bacterium REEB67]|nr:D-alanine--D-alanine ligase [Cyanobacteria bacterium REEB67]
MKVAPKLGKETTIGVLYGGTSNEREVSLRSGQNCFNALQRLGYKNATLIDVGENLAEDLKAKQIEVAFLSLHGRYGEDGTVQGLLELLKVPYTGSGVLSSALAMNKPLTKRVLSAQGLPYPQSYILTEFELADLDQFLKTLPPPPVMIKPLNEGSSVGVHKVENAAEIGPLVRETVEKFGGAIVEHYIKGQEITVGVLEETSRKDASASKENGHAAHASAASHTFSNQSELRALPILELRPKSKAGFYDYEAKYTKGMTDFVLPAELSEQTTAKAKELAKKTFRALNCSGYSRVDMMVDKDGGLFILEVNTLPGMTDTSDLPAMAEVEGISYDELVEKILFSAGLDK